MQRIWGHNRTQRVLPAQLVHDFECLPHVPGVESDGTLPFDSIFFVQSVWTKSSAPEKDKQAITQTTRVIVFKVALVMGLMNNQQ